MTFDNDRLNWWPALTTYFSYGVIVIWGYFLDFMTFFFPQPGYNKPGYAPITRDWDAFYRRRVYGTVSDCWNRPITGPANNVIKVLERKRVNGSGSQYRLTGEQFPCVNLSSYNYLGFATLPEERQAPLWEALEKYGVSTCATALDGGYTSAHKKLEETVAEFLGVEDAMVFGMGWGTNATAFPALVGKGSLIISDSANHASIAVGARSTGAKIKIFKHNDMKHLEQIIVNSITQGQPISHRPWKKILIVAEGIYSMEGSTPSLREIIALKKKYKCYLYMDEAHSIGALGKTGRGICEFSDVDPKDVDVLMGTFTKSFGAIGGYVAGKRRLVEAVRRLSASSFFTPGLSPVCTYMTQIAFDIIMGKDGTDLGARKMKQLKENSNYYRAQLRKLGYQVLGEIDSPVVPIMIANPGKLIAVSRECLKRGMAVVSVGFPATALLTSKVRFCISASHTREELEDCIKAMDEVGDLLHLKYVTKVTG